MPAATSPKEVPQVHLRPPHPRLSGVVHTYYLVTVAGGFTDRLYPEWGNIRLPLHGRFVHDCDGGAMDVPPGGGLFGPTDRWTKVQSTGGQGVGVLLTALGWARLIGTPADRLANRMAPLDTLLGQRGEAIANVIRARPDEERADAVAALLDGLLLARLDAQPNVPLAAAAAEAALRDRPADAAAFARAAGLSPGALRRVCRAAFGFGPKRLLRRERLADAVARIRAAEQPRLGALHGPEFTDQAHFTREFAHFMGITPRGYLVADRPLMHEVARAWPGQTFPVIADEGPACTAAGTSAPPKRSVAAPGDDEAVAQAVDEHGADAPLQ